MPLTDWFETSLDLLLLEPFYALPSSSEQLDFLLPITPVLSVNLTDITL